MSLTRGIHHVAYRCKDAKETVDWYQRHLKMEFLLAISEDTVPSTGEFDPYMHIFLDAGRGNVLAFFELPNAAEMTFDPNTPRWVQHIALQVDSEEVLISTKTRLESEGIEVLGPTDHTLFRSIYFFDPNGHRIELAADAGRRDLESRLLELRQPMIEHWDQHKTAPPHAQFLHDDTEA
ncbi:MAG TPA: glyoxalase [Myxococcales bacterium]|nr:glyoxalase [Myxococcales bacterium]HAN31480.1 glyoxalase [Myxococcales bacterium]